MKLSRANFKVIKSKNLPRGKHVGYILKTRSPNNQSEIRFPSLPNAPVYAIKGNRLGKKLGNEPVGKNRYGPSSLSRKGAELTRKSKNGPYTVVVKSSDKARSHTRNIK